MYLMRARWLVTPVGATLALAAAAAWAKPGDSAVVKGDDVDITPIREGLEIAHDGSGHYIAAMPEGNLWELYYGDGKVFYRQRVFGGGKNGGKGTADWMFWSPRQPNHASVEYDNGTYTVFCGNRNKNPRKTPMHPLSDAETRKMLASAKFKTLPFKRVPHRLARDRRGIYYFVDRQRGGKGYQLHVGRRGNMKKFKLIDVVDDSEGQIFVTKKGELHLVFDKGDTSVTWSQGKKETRLKEIPVDRNRVLIYTDLGVYTGVRLGTPCDDL